MASARSSQQVKPWGFGEKFGQLRFSPGMTANEIQQQIRQDNRYARYEAARTLYQQGYTIRAIPRRLGHARETITRYVQA